MKRITTHNAAGEPIFDCGTCQAEGNLCHLYPCRTRAMRCLAAYEDTGLTPEEVIALKKEFEKVKKIRDDYATSARAIHLYLKEFCDETLPYPEMIADAVRRLSKKIEKTKENSDVPQASYQQDTDRYSKAFNC